MLRRELELDLVYQVVALHQRRQLPVASSALIQAHIKDAYDFVVSKSAIQQILRNKLGMSYRRARSVPVQANSERCLVLRQQYAMVMFEQLEKGQRVINVDESWLNESSFFRKIWASKSQPATYQLRNVSPRISLIAAIDNKGNAWYALNQSNTDSSVMLLFLKSLMETLDYESPGW